VIRSAGWPVELNMLGLDNPLHLVFLGLIALLVLGPKRLPVMARSLGTGMREFRASLTERVDGGDEPVQEGRAQVVAPVAPVAQPVAPQPVAAVAEPAVPTAD
jgi:sec-independent protein translocase protein TatA